MNFQRKSILAYPLIPFFLINWDSACPEFISGMSQLINIYLDVLFLGENPYAGYWMPGIQYPTSSTYSNAKERNSATQAGFSTPSISIVAFQVDLTPLSP